MHTRSFEIVGAVLSHCDEEHVATAVQLDAFVVVEKFVPALHDLHTRSLVSEWTVEIYCPGAQSVKFVHTRSFEAVGAVLSHSVPVHVVTAVQLEALVVVEKFVPALHAVHTRSLVSE